VEALTQRFEADRPRPWTLADAPEGYIDRLAGGIVGVELRITRIEAKRKLSQNRSEADRQGVIKGLSESATHEARRAAEAMRAAKP
jgi:transcriptional regulator